MLLHKILATNSEFLALQISLESAWANRDVNVGIHTANITCSSIQVMWKINWDAGNNRGYFITILSKIISPA